MEKLVVFLEESGAPQTREDILAALNTSVKGTRKALHAMSEHGMILHEFKEISENGQLIKKSFYRSIFLSHYEKVMGRSPYRYPRHQHYLHLLETKFDRP